MCNRVLLVDDDQMLLNSMERCLGLDFELATALTGAQALRLIEEQPTYGVIISDMRMPGMDGVEFLKRARDASPLSVLMMLTGNQDVRTAIRAVNEGQVATFLNKPCDPSEIAAAIKSGLRRHELELSERQLLTQTFAGAVGMLTDVMETLEPTLIGRAAHSEELVEALRERCGIESRWEYKLASKLSLIGYVLGPDPAPDEAGPPESVAACSRAAAKIVARIPRLSVVAQIIEASAGSAGRLPDAAAESEAEIAAVGASLLRVAQLVEGFAYQGADKNEAETRLRTLLPHIDDRLLRAAAECYPIEAKDLGVSVTLNELRAGMVLQANLQRRDGAVLMRAGRKLSQTHIDKLLADEAAFSQGDVAVITRESFDAARCPDQVAAAT